MPPLKVFFLSTIFECFFIAYVGTSLFRIKATAKQLILIAFIDAIVSFGMRFEGIFGHIIKLGVHTIILVCLLTIVMGLVLKIPFRISFLAASLPIILVLLGDSILLVPIMKHFTPITVMELPEHPWKWILFGWISDGFLIATAIFIGMTGFGIFPFLNHKSKMLD